MAPRQALSLVALAAACALCALVLSTSSWRSPTVLVGMDSSSGIHGAPYMPESIPWKFPSAGPWGPSADPHKLSSVEYMPPDSSDWYWHPSEAPDSATENAEPGAAEEESDDAGNPEEDAQAASASEGLLSETGQDVGVEVDDETSEGGDDDTSAPDSAAAEERGRPTMLKQQQKARRTKHSDWAQVADALHMTRHARTAIAQQRAKVLGCRGVHYMTSASGDQLVSPCASQTAEFAALRSAHFTARADLGTTLAGASPDFEGRQFRRIVRDGFDPAGAADDQFLARGGGAAQGQAAAPPRVSVSRDTGALNLLGDAAGAADDALLGAVAQHKRARAHARARTQKPVWHTW